MRDHHFNDEGGCYRGLIFEQGYTSSARCCRHATADQRALVAEQNARAPRIGIDKTRTLSGWGDIGMDWPYGAYDDVTVRQALLDWAEPLGLKESRSRSSCWRCWFKRSPRCTLSDWAHRHMGGWIDHPSNWNLNGKPHVFVSQPYDLPDRERAEIETAVAEMNEQGHNLRLEISQETGWYGYRAMWIAIWRNGEVSR